MPSEKFSVFSVVLRVAPLVLGLAACAETQPTGPSVSAVSPPGVSARVATRDDAACRAKAAGASERALAAKQPGLQGLYDSVYTDCMLNRGYVISQTSVSYAPAPYYYGPGPGPGFYAAPVVTYGWSGGWAGGFGPGGGWGGGWGRRW